MADQNPRDLSDTGVGFDVSGIRAMAKLETEVANVGKDVKEIKYRMDTKLVERSEFLPVKLIAYGLVGIICTSVIGSLVYLVVH